MKNKIKNKLKTFFKCYLPGFILGWAKPATLNTYLNSTYYNGLNSTAQSQIVAKDFSIGSITYNNTDLGNQVKDENSTIWKGKIALITLSEYLRTNSIQSCNTFNLYRNNYNTCKNTTWMYINDSWWTLSSRVDTSNRVFNIHSGGHLDANGYIYAGNVSFAIRPTVYLNSEVTLTGSGTQSDPYVVNS